MADENNTGGSASRIEPPPEGCDVRYLRGYLDAAIQRINALSNVTVSPAGAGSMQVSDSNAVLTIGTPGKPEKVYGAVNGKAATLNILTDGKGWSLVE